MAAQAGRGVGALVEILYLAWNRRAFTQATLTALLANTNLDLVDRIVIYDDGSTDGTSELVEASRVCFRVPVEVRHTNFRSPPSVMNDYVLHSDADLFVKLDNDAMVCWGWLEALLGVMESNPEIELLGMEAGMTRVTGRPGDEPWDGVYGFEPSTHIGGIGLMRRKAFTARPVMLTEGRNGFTEFQHVHEPVRGWITPDLAVPLLDRLPMEPWRSLSLEYVRQGWQRPWQCYDERWMEWAWEWFPPELMEGVAA